MPVKTHAILLFFIFLINLGTGSYFCANGQSANVPLNRDYYHLLDRFEIMSGQQSESFFTALKPFRREAVGSFVGQIYDDSLSLTEVDKFNLEYLAIDNWTFTEYGDPESRKPFLKHFFQKKNDLLYVGTDDFEMHLNPVFHFSGGIEREDDVTPYINTRGLEISGIISGKIGFYTYMSTTQAAFPSYVRTYIYRNQAVPQEGYWKTYNEDGVDFFTARGYVSFNIVKPLNFQFGYDKLYMGNGIRSMGLSDFANNFLFFKLDLKVWKLNYRFVIAQHNVDTIPPQPGRQSVNGPYPRKYMAYHHISFNIGKNLNLGLFEYIVQGDSASNSLDINYLNPVIFFRGLEHQGGSKDNAILGFDLKYNFLQRFSFYSQFLLDEFLLDEVTSGEGWWANKYGYQLGLKYINAFWIKNLDLNLEYNVARPYTYAHINTYTNFSNYNMPLAHPTGANLKEFIFLARYQPISRFTFTGKFVVSDYGEDDENSNWGKDVMKTYITREQEYGNTIGQGLTTHLRYFNFTATYQFKHNVFFDIDLVLHNVESELSLIDNNVFFTGIHFRWNIPRREFDF
ncbi:MAG: hypothetical protein KFF73_16820 [Cyclobacteriaceae bacterium]|nr:hypothetical protein [Cyclobacteriaceae bacterium]